MLVIEGQGLLDRVVESQGVANGGGGVIGVAGPVDLAALDHQEEALVVVQHLDGLGRKLGQGDVGTGHVHDVGHGLVVLQPTVPGQDLAVAPA